MLITGNFLSNNRCPHWSVLFFLQINAPDGEDDGDRHNDAHRDAELHEVADLETAYGIHHHHVGGGDLRGEVAGCTEKHREHEGKGIDAHIGGGDKGNGGEDRHHGGIKEYLREEYCRYGDDDECLQRVGATEPLDEDAYVIGKSAVLYGETDGEGTCEYDDEVPVDAVKQLSLQISRRSY